MREPVGSGSGGWIAPATSELGAIQGTVLGFDFGIRRTGVAVGDLGVGIAHPLCTVEGHSDAERIEQIATLVAEWSPVLFVVGLPMQDDGIEHALGRKVRRFARQLGTRFQIEVKLVDERLTSVQAQSNLRDAGIRGREQKRVLDRVAAQIILESFLNSGHAAS